jgi:hypothetical protein
MQLQKLLFEPTLVRSVPQIVKWWESRRLTYNAVVGAVGLGSLAYVTLIDRLFFAGSGGPPLVLAAVYGIAANVCYSLGWFAEITIQRWLKEPAYGLGPAMFRYGLVFSIGLTLLPVGIATASAIAKLIFG